MQGAPPRKKIRCPKCTALLAEPTSPVFECPICSTLLTGKGGNRVTTQGVYAKNGDYAESAGQKGAPDPINDGSNKSATNVEKGRTILERLADEQKKLMALKNDTAQGQILTGNDKQDVPNAGNDVPLLPKTITQNEAGSFNNKDMVQDHLNYADNRAKVQLPVANADKSTPGSENVNKQDFERKKNRVDGNKWSLQAQMFRDGGYDLSFKYSLRASESDVAPEESHMDKHNEYAEESSDPSGDEVYSSGAETASQGGSESDFDFPAPSTETFLSGKLSRLFNKNEESEIAVSMQPHQLELKETYHGVNVETGSLGENHVNTSTGRILENNYTFKQLQNDKQPSGSIAVEGVAPSPAVAVNDLTKEKNTSDDLLENSNQASPGSVKIKNLEENIQSLTLYNQSIPSVAFAKTDKTNESLEKDGSPVHLDNKITSELIESKIPSTHDSQERESNQDIAVYGTASNIISARNLANKEIGFQKLIQSDMDNTYTHEEDLYCVPLHGTERMENTVNDDFALVEQSMAYHQRKNAHERLRLYDSEGRLIPQIERKKKDYAKNMPILNCQGEMNEQDPGRLSHESLNKFVGYSVANTQQYGYVNHHHIPDAFSIGVPPPNNSGCSCHGIPHHLMLPGPSQEQAFSQCTYHSASPVCMMCFHHQHPHMPQMQMPHCAACFGQSVSPSHQTGPSECWSCQSRHVPPPAYGGHLPYFSKMTEIRDAFNVELNSQISSPRTEKHYPPLPQGCAAPYIICKGCSRVLRVPSYLPSSAGTIKKLRCGACSKVSKFSLHQNSQQAISIQAFYTRHNQISGGTKVIDYYHGSASPIMHPQPAQNINKKNHDGAPFYSSLNYAPKPFNVTTSEHNVDEKEEGLDFGAPRISDGDSLDQSDSRTRSPENYPEYNPDDCEDVASLKANQGELARTKLGNDGRHDKKPGSPLLVLLNQESKKFNITLPSEESRHTYGVPAANMGPGDKSAPTSTSPYDRDQDLSRSNGSRSHHSLTRGTRYIPGFLRRSLNKGN